MSETPEVTLNVTDIADAVKIIDYATEQGAYRGWNNIRQILAVRDRLDAFVAATADTSKLNTEGSALTEAVTPPSASAQGEATA